MLNIAQIDVLHNMQNIKTASHFTTYRQIKSTQLNSFLLPAMASCPVLELVTLSNH